MEIALAETSINAKKIDANVCQKRVRIGAALLFLTGVAIISSAHAQWPTKGVIVLQVGASMLLDQRLIQVYLHLQLQTSLLLRLNMLKHKMEQMQQMRQMRQIPIEPLVELPRRRLRPHQLGLPAQRYLCHLSYLPPHQECHQLHQNHWG
jgi:hypothetical protein